MHPTGKAFTWTSMPALRLFIGPKQLRFPLQYVHLRGNFVARVVTLDVGVFIFDVNLLSPSLSAHSFFCGTLSFVLRTYANKQSSNLKFWDDLIVHMHLRAVQIEDGRKCSKNGILALTCDYKADRNLLIKWLMKTIRQFQIPWKLLIFPSIWPYPPFFFKKIIQAS